MPDMSGIDVFKKQKLLNLQTEVPIIALAASATAEEKEEIHRIGFAKYLSKPIEPSRLVEELSTWLSYHKVSVSAETVPVEDLSEAQLEELCGVESMINSLQDATAPIDFKEVEAIVTKLQSCTSIPEVCAFSHELQDNLNSFDITALSESAHLLTEICKKLFREVQHG